MSARGADEPIHQRRRLDMEAFDLPLSALLDHSKAELGITLLKTAGGDLLCGHHGMAAAHRQYSLAPAVAICEHRSQLLAGGGEQPADLIVARDQARIRACRFHNSSAFQFAAMATTDCSTYALLARSSASPLGLSMKKPRPPSTISVAETAPSPKKQLLHCGCPEGMNAGNLYARA